MRVLVTMMALWAIVIYVPPKVQAMKKRPPEKAASVRPLKLARQPLVAATTEV
ncbi:hypothetical protein [Edaphobacter flagellatus]|uniref:hypothetical protein n=1 Tax=Edaphobacter flagellatus TaxID=1933044 RepID=UPI0021B46F2C|nr:hypothetical protein [Edaphobacter flagellatus]